MSVVVEGLGLVERVFDLSQDAYKTKLPLLVLSGLCFLSLEFLVSFLQPWLFRKLKAIDPNMDRKAAEKQGQQFVGRSVAFIHSIVQVSMAAQFLLHSASTPTESPE